MRQINPIGEQIIIRTLPPDRVGSIIIPDSAKRITHQGEDQSPLAGSEELQYVNRWLFEDMTETMKRFVAGMYATSAGFSMNLTDEEQELLSDLVSRAEKSILPKTEKGILPSAGAGIHFVEAEVVAVGSGVRAKDPRLFDEVISNLRNWVHPPRYAGRTDLFSDAEVIERQVKRSDQLLTRTEKEHRVPFLVKPGDRILYHPSVQKFDRQIPPEWIGLEPGDGDVFIIREESVLAILDHEEIAQSAA